MDLFLFWVDCERVEGLLSRPCRSDRFSRSCCRDRKAFFGATLVFFSTACQQKKGAPLVPILALPASLGNPKDPTAFTRARRGSRSETAKDKSFANVCGVLILASWARERCPTGLSVYQMITKAAWQRTHTHGFVAALHRNVEQFPLFRLVFLRFSHHPMRWINHLAGLWEMTLFDISCHHNTGCFFGVFLPNSKQINRNVINGIIFFAFLRTIFRAVLPITTGTFHFGVTCIVYM